MNHYKNKYFLMFLLLVLVGSACKKQWNLRTEVTDQQLNINLMQQIQANPSLSTFAGYLTKIGYDQVLAASKTYTVWAPTNAALTGIDPAIVADTAKLKRFVSNHIANQVFLTSNASPAIRVRTLLGKNVTFSTTTVEEATISAANQYVANGVLHVIDKPLTPKMNISEYIRSLTTVGLLHKAYILGQDTTFTDTSKATVASIDPKTGKPILVAGTGRVTQNKYFNRTVNLANEDSTYTYFVLTDDAYNAERNKVSKYFTTVSGSTDSTMNILSAFNVLKDAAARPAYPAATIPASVKSVLGVNIPVDKSAIVQTYNASNGIVYVMNSVNFAIADKITPITIEAERPSFYSRTDHNGKIAFRARVDPNLVRFTDLLITGSGLPAAFFSAYKISGLYTCQYKVVMRADNDTLITHIPTSVTGNVSQRVIFGQTTAITVVSGTQTPTTVVNFPYAPTKPYDFSEVPLTGATGTSTASNTINVVGGTLNVLKYAPINMYVQGANVTTTNLNNITFDYIKLIPIIQ